MADPAIAEATADDVDDLRAFFWEAWAQAGPDAPGWAGADDEVMGELTAPDAILERLGGPDRRMFLARREGRVAGFAATRRIDPATVELAGVIVLQSLIGRGVGGGLVDAAIAGAVGDGYRQMVVRTEADNDRARAFYRRHGFVEGAGPVDSVEGVEAVLVELRRDVG
ncbi:MAG TPA: GNAT family N-acetyltransferase [Acidimicrobiia bacterium]